jgi:broad specificity phosphatase PhoE
VPMSGPPATRVSMMRHGATEMNCSSLPASMAGVGQGRGDQGLVRAGRGVVRGTSLRPPGRAQREADPPKVRVSPSAAAQATV